MRRGQGVVFCLQRDREVCHHGTDTKAVRATNMNPASGIASTQRKLPFISKYTKCPLYAYALNIHFRCNMQHEANFNWTFHRILLGGYDVLHIFSAKGNERQIDLETESEICDTCLQNVPLVS